MRISTMAPADLNHEILRPSDLQSLYDDRSRSDSEINELRSRIQIIEAKLGIKYVSPRDRYRRKRCPTCKRLNKNCQCD